MTTLSGWKVDLTTSPRTITIPVGTSIATAQDQVDTVRKLEDTFQAMGHPHLMDAVGKAGGGVTGIIIVYQDCQLAPESQSVIAQSGTVTTSDTRGLQLTNSAALFITNGVKRSDLINNSTSSGYSTIATVIS